MTQCRWLVVMCLLAFAGCGSGPASKDTVPAANTGGTEMTTEHLRFTLPASWQRGEPSSKMRIAQAAIPGSGGAGEMAVFYFGPGQGGTVQANLDRWISQMDLAPGPAPHPENFQVNGCSVTWIDVAGTLKPGGMGMGPSTAQPGSRLLGAVVEGPGGPWFFKATGPDATLSAERNAFLDMLKSVRPQ